jgi:hypothetical protein
MWSDAIGQEHGCGKAYLLNQESIIQETRRTMNMCICQGFYPWVLGGLLRRNQFTGHTSEKIHAYETIHQ